MSRSISPLFPLGLVLAVSALGGCAVLAPQTCEQFEAKRKQTDYTTSYKRDDKETVKSVRKGPAAMVAHYELRLDTGRARACSHVMIRKELVLARRDDVGATLEETREFFAEDGGRIATRTENLSAQLRQSGRYTAVVPLPIPQNAPAGTYYLVSTIALKLKHETQVLAKTTASFDVIASK